eukprot:TRINITY_DN867_c0_g1_i4.p1 TRINITY_DN867_c0_g1~~TRINITY_DN867_c0_g1_i4.p1  ORF type:complete len:514 (+),score=41.04 TRINITY_DN867_c0_g1_i4:150-1691(+)
MRTMGALPQVTLCGPYVYKYREEKFNIEFSDDWSQVSYEVSTEYTFQPDRSNGSESDMLWTVNLPFLSGVQTFYSTQNHGLDDETFIGCKLFGETGIYQACLFGLRNVTEIIWTQYNFEIELSNSEFFINRPMNPNVGLLTKCSGPDDCHVQNTDRVNFGLGGSCTLVYPNNKTGTSDFINATFCLDPIQDGTEDKIKWYVTTGHGGTLDDLWKIRKWMGNDSIWFWNTTYDPVTGLPNRVEPIAGANIMFQFKRFLDKSDILQTFDDNALQSVYLQYVKENNLYDVPLWRFRTTDALYAGNDPFYFGNGTMGMHNVSTPALIVHGAPAPIFASRIFMAGADPKYKSMFNCTGCPYVDPTLSNDDYDYIYGSWLELNPELGKVLRGSKSTQFNAEIGQDYLFGSGAQNDYYSNLTYAMLPVLSVNMTVSFNDTQANIVNDGLDDLHFGQNAEKGIRIASYIAFGLLAVAAVLCWCRWRMLMRDAEDPPFPVTTVGETDGGKGSLQDTTYKRMG